MKTKAQIDGGKEGREKGLRNEDRFIKLLDGVKPKPGPVESVIPWARHAVNKVDFILSKENCSLKTSGRSTQIQVCELSKFVQKFKCPQDITDKLYKFFGADFKKKKGVDQSDEFINKCTNDWGIDAKKLCPKDEIRRNRLLANNIEGFDDVIQWFKDNVKSVMEFILSTGFCKNEENHAQYLLWSLEEADDEKCDADIFLIKDIVNKSMEWDVSVRSSQSVIEIGAFTLQMKGSGESSAYHSMQFNTSLKDLSKYMGE